MATELFSFYDEATGVLTTQRAPYIEDGWYVETHTGGVFKVFEIPPYGGDSCEQGEFSSFKLAYEFALSIG